MNRMQEDVLGRALQEEGRRMGPGFSRLLHERVMRGLAECGMEVSPERRRGNWRLKVLVPVGLAAGMAIAAGMWVEMHPGAGTSHPAVVVNKGGPLEMPNIPEVEEAIAPAGAEDGETLEQARYASLNKDAEKLVSFVADQVPSFTQ
jgi:hypothetical protein